MSSLLNKYQNSRRSRYNPQRGGSLYPSLDDLNDRDQPKRTTSTIKNGSTYDKYSYTDRKNGLCETNYAHDFNTKRTEVKPEYNREEIYKAKSFLKGYDTGNNIDLTPTTRKNSESYRESCILDEPKRSYSDRDRHLSTLQEDRSNWAVPKKYTSTTQRNHLSSPIKTLRTSQARAIPKPSKSIYKVLEQSPEGVSLKYKVSKPSRVEAERKGGLLSRVVNYFSHNDDKEVTKLERSARSIVHGDQLSSKRVSFSDSTYRRDERNRYHLDIDPVDEAIRNQRLDQMRMELESYKRREEESQRNLEEYLATIQSLREQLSRSDEHAKRIAEDVDYEKQRYDREIAELKRTIDLLRQELDMKEDTINKDREEISQLRSHNRKLTAENELMIPQEELIKAKEQLLLKIRELDDARFILQNELEQTKKDLESQTKENKFLHAEMSIREKLRIASEELEKDFELLGAESAQTERKIIALQKQYDAVKRNKSLPPILDDSSNKFQKTQKNIETAIEYLNDYTQISSSIDIASYEKYYNEVKSFLDEQRSKMRKTIGDALLDLDNDQQIRHYYQHLFSSLYSLKRLITISSMLVQLKELIGTCKILESYKSEGVDVADIFRRLDLERI